MAKDRRSIQQRHAPSGGVAVSSSQLVQFHQGPLPDPATLERYNQVLPGLAERIVSMAEAEGQNRRALEQAEQKFRWRAQLAGVGAGTIVALAMTGAAAFAIAVGAPAAGVAAIVAEIATLAAVFVWGRRRVEKSVQNGR